MEKYDISKEASEDLYRIWEYTVDTWSEKQADWYYSLLISSFERIAANPGKTGKSYDEIIPGIRAYHVRKHMIFYTIQANGRVLIARVLHERMDFRRHFNA